MSHCILLYDVRRQQPACIKNPLANRARCLEIRLAVHHWLRYSSADVLPWHPKYSIKNPSVLENHLYAACHINHFLQIQPLFEGAGNTSLSLRYLQLENIPHIFHFSVFRRYLRSLDLSHNQLELYSYAFRSHPGLYKLFSLTHLDLSYNQITSISHKIAGLTQLRHLNLSANQLTKLPSCIGSLNQLQLLNLAHN